MNCFKISFQSSFNNVKVLSMYVWDCINSVFSQLLKSNCEQIIVILEIFWLSHGINDKSRDQRRIKATTGLLCSHIRKRILQLCAFSNTPWMNEVSLHQYLKIRVLLQAAELSLKKKHTITKHFVDYNNYMVSFRLFLSYLLN